MGLQSWRSAAGLSLSACRRFRHGRMKRRSTMAEKKVVISIFADEAAADAAVVSLKDEGVAFEDAIGVLVLDEKGNVKTHKVGSHSFYKGAGIGLILGLLGPIGVGVGIGVGMGAAAVGVLAGLDEADAIESMLTGLGGVSEAHTVDDEALEAVANEAAPANA